MLILLVYRAEIENLWCCLRVPAVTVEVTEVPKPSGTGGAEFCAGQG